MIFLQPFYGSFGGIFGEKGLKGAQKRVKGIFLGNFGTNFSNPAIFKL
jgi:hypothetical protein